MPMIPLRVQTPNIIDMIIDSLSRSSRYLPLHPLFERAFEAIRSVDPATAEPGTITLIDNELILMINRPTLKLPEKARLEIHRDMLDLHIPLSGLEGYAWKPAASLTTPAEPYQPTKDAQHYLDAPDARLTLHPGQFALFYPEDAHAGCIGNGEMLKIVVKIRITSRTAEASYPGRS